MSDPKEPNLLSPGSSPSGRGGGEGAAKPHGQFLVYPTEDGRVKIEVRLENETVWLTQQHMAALFQTTIPNISMHIHNIFVERELQADSVVNEFLTTAADGKNYSTKFYNLDVIISVGYRVKTAVATRFRIWATQKLREYIVKGFVLDIFAEGQALRRVSMHMHDWIAKLNAFLTLNERAILDHAGKISHELARELAEAEYEKFHRKQIAQADQAGGDFDQAIKQLLPPPKRKKGVRK